MQTSRPNAATPNAPGSLNNLIFNKLGAQPEGGYDNAQLRKVLQGLSKYGLAEDPDEEGEGVTMATSVGGGTNASSTGVSILNEFNPHSRLIRAILKMLAARGA